MSGSLTPEQIDTFDTEGFLVLRGLLDHTADLRPIIDEYSLVLDRLATKLVDTGELADAYAHLGFSERLVTISAHVGRDLTQHFDFSLPQASTEPDTPMWTGPAVFALLRHDGILSAIESLIGGEIFANPVQHVRLKVPEHRMPRDATTGEIKNQATPWHQDNGVVTEDADETEMITVWLPLGPATHENGCLVVQPRGHTQGVLPHCSSASPVGSREGGPGLRIPQVSIGSEVQELEMAAGDVLLMHRRTPHSSGHNTSDDVRWSFDLRYHPVGQPTGRSVLPGFVARSHAQPDSELRDAEAWAQLWRDARDRVSAGPSVTFNRWHDDAVICA